MKKIWIGIVALLIMATAQSCNKGSAKDVATTWLNSFYHLDYEKAKTLSTEETKTLITSLQQFTNMIPDSNKAEAKNMTITVKNVKEDGDKAIATYTKSNSMGKEETIDLMKVNGKWLVQFSKNDQMKNLEDPAGDQPAATDTMGAGSTTPAGTAPTDTTAAKD